MKKIFSIIVIFLMVSVNGIPQSQGVVCDNGISCETPCSGIQYDYHLTDVRPSYLWTIDPPNAGTIIGSNTLQSVTVIWSGTGPAKLTDSDGGWTYGFMNVIRFTFPQPTILGNSETCINTVENYTTEPNQNNYSWNVMGGNIVSQNGYSIIVNWTTGGSGTVYVSYRNNGTCLGDTIKNVTVNYTPTPIITSNQSDTLCTGSNGYYTTQGGCDTYNWEVTGGDKIVQDSVCYVTWNTGPVHTIRVTVTKNGCSSTSNLKSVTVITSTTPTVNGESNVCNGNEFSYTTDPGKTNYFWSLPEGGGSIQSGQGTDSIVVLWNSPIVNHTVFVRYMNLGLCESSKTKSIYVYPTPQSIIISGDTNIVVGHQSVYSTSPGFPVYHWIISTGGTIISDSTLNHITVNWSDIGNRWVKVKYSTGLCNSIPVEYHVSVTPSICMVTYDSVTNKNKIIVNPITDNNYTEIKFYKLGNTSTYELLGTIPINQTEFIDTTSIPYQTHYTYRVSVGVPESMKSPSHTTIWLHYEKTGSQVDLLWTPYSGFTFDSYHIYRKVGSGNWNQIGQVNNSTLVFTDIYSGTENPTYYIEVIPPCSIKSSGQTVTSNKVKIGGVGIDSKSYTDVRIFPNPVNKTLTIELRKQENRLIRVYDLLGKEWLNLSSDQEKINLNVETIPSGIYILKIQSESLTTTTKFCKE